MKEKPTIVAKRMKELQEGIEVSQAKLAACLDNVEQTAIFRCESGQSFPPYRILMQYSDFLMFRLTISLGGVTSRKAGYTTSNRKYGKKISNAGTD